MPFLSRQSAHTTTSSSLKSSSGAAPSQKTPFHSRSNQQGFDVTSHPPMPDYDYGRRGSLPTASLSQNHPRSSSTKPVDKDYNRAQNKRYPLPLPYNAVVEMDKILGDGRSSQKVAQPHPFPKADMGVGRPYVGADGRLWRDREEELEYTGLLASPQAYRRGSDDTILGDEVTGSERHGRREWAQFSARHPGGVSGSSSSRHPAQRSSRSRQYNSSATSDDEDDSTPTWSPVVETHPAQHQFPAYAFPQSSKSSSRSSSSRTPAYPAAPMTDDRTIPLPVSINDFAVPSSSKAPHVHHVPRAREDFLESAFVPPRGSSGSSSRPPVAESRRTARRSSVQGIMPVSATQQPHPHSRHPHAAVAPPSREIVVPLPALKPSAPPSSSSERSASSSSSAGGNKFLVSESFTLALAVKQIIQFSFYLINRLKCDEKKLKWIERIKDTERYMTDEAMSMLNGSMRPISLGSEAESVSASQAMMYVISLDLTMLFDNGKREERWSGGSGPERHKLGIISVYPRQRESIALCRRERVQSYRKK
ncbi:hypothetical protein DL93DRAFT_2095934 [Clavulina sp. PMI_390]|nr:hypothetical protein DL93DRAFT_2095934 [Clavulina sp. PMI_390]